MDGSLNRFRCPETGENLQQVSSWMAACQDRLFPKLAGTWILQPRIESFLRDELWTITRSLTQFAENPEISNWYMENFGRWKVPDPMAIDSAIAGEGYPGFWEAMDLPEFLEPLVSASPEQIVSGWAQAFQPRCGLDLGCGQGGMTHYMAGICETVIGVEHNLFLAASANAFLKSGTIEFRLERPGYNPLDDVFKVEKRPNAEVVCADALALPVDQGCVDWLHVGNLIDLLDDPLEALAHWFDFLRPNALISVATPWDTADQESVQAIKTMLVERCDTLQQEDEAPWVRINHGRRFVVHSEWLWMGRFRG